MLNNTIGENFVLTCFGESHGSCVGIVIDGCPPGLYLTEEDIQTDLDKRKPIDDFSTSRVEEDRINILTGVLNNYTTGAPITLLVWNKNKKSDVYEDFRRKPRPGHADYPAFMKYRGFNDYRGGGIFSSRLTIGYVAAGSIAKKLLKMLNIEVYSHTVEIGGVRIKKSPSLKEIKRNTYSNPMRCAVLSSIKEMEKKIKAAKNNQDSVGGIVEAIAMNIPIGLGEPIFNSLDAALAKFLFCIPAVKGVEFGAGFKAAQMKGSENNDQYRVRTGKIITTSNNAGGILGGLSTGMPLIVKVAFKPPSSIFKKQKTIDLKKGVNTELEIKGRYDACFIPRAVPIVEAVVANVLADFTLPQIKNKLEKTNHYSEHSP